MTQCERIIDYMNRYGSITALEAMDNFGCMRLASRISDLKKDGYRIKVEHETKKNRYGEPTTFCRYSLEE